jgi:hypothetical protein
MAPHPPCSGSDSVAAHANERGREPRAVSLRLAVPDAPTVGAAGVPSPSAASRVSSASSQRSAFPISICEKCGSHIAAWFCEDCDMKLCEKKCFLDIHKLKRNRHHVRRRILPLAPPSPRTAPAQVAEKPLALDSRANLAQQPTTRRNSRSEPVSLANAGTPQRHLAADGGTTSTTAHSDSNTSLAESGQADSYAAPPAAPTSKAHAAAAEPPHVARLATASSMELAGALHAAEGTAFEESHVPVLPSAQTHSAAPLLQPRPPPSPSPRASETANFRRRSAVAIDGRSGAPPSAGPALSSSTPNVAPLDGADDAANGRRASGGSNTGRAANAIKSFMQPRGGASPGPGPVPVPHPPSEGLSADEVARRVLLHALRASKRREAMQMKKGHIRKSSTLSCLPTHKSHSVGAGPPELSSAVGSGSTSVARHAPLLRSNTQRRESGGLPALRRAKQGAAGAPSAAAAANATTAAGGPSGLSAAQRASRRRTAENCAINDDARVSVLSQPPRPANESGVPTLPQIKTPTPQASPLAAAAAQVPRSPGADGSGAPRASSAKRGPTPPPLAPPARDAALKRA